MHTFEPVNSGVRNLWEIDAGANVRFSFEYRISNRISPGIGRSSLDKIVDLNSRIAILHQSESGDMPVSVSLTPAIVINTTDPGFLPDDYLLTDRINYGFSLPIARKFNGELCLQLSPMLIHFNRVGTEVNIINPEVNTY